MTMQQQAEYPPPYQQMTQPVPQQSVSPPQQMMQPSPQPSQPQVIVVHSGSSYIENYAAETSKTLGVIQVIGGALAIVFQAILTILGFSFYYALRMTGTGFYCGILFIVAGSFGIAAGKYKNGFLITAYLVLAIIGAVFTTLIFVGGIFYSYWGYGVNIAFNSLLLITGLVELITFIRGSVLGCKAMCHGHQQHMTVPVQYVNGQIIPANRNGQVQAVPQMSFMTPPHAERYNTPAAPATHSDMEILIDGNTH